MKELLTFFDFGFYAELGRAVVILLVYQRVNLGGDYDAVREDGMIKARIFLSQLSIRA